VITMNDQTASSRRERQMQNEQLNQLREALQHPPTRVVIRWLLHDCGIYDVGVHEERRAVGLGLIHAIGEVDPYEYVRLMKEGADDLVARRSKTQKLERTDDY